MPEIKANKFKSREELDAYIKREIGDNITLNRSSDNVIIGDKDTLDKLFLDQTTFIYGIKVKIK